MENDINNFVPSLLNPRTFVKDRGDLSLTQNSIVSRCSLSLRRNNTNQKSATKNFNKENFGNNRISYKNLLKPPPPKESKRNEQKNVKVDDKGSIGFPAIQDLDTVKNFSNSPPSFYLEPEVELTELQVNKTNFIDNEKSLISLSSATELNECLQSVSDDNDKTVLYEGQSILSVSLGIKNCNSFLLSTNKSNIKKIHLSTENDQTTVDCEVIECSQPSTVSNTDENMNETIPTMAQKRSAVAVNLEIKRKKTSCDKADNSKVLILNTDAIEKLSHVIVQPPNYKIVKRQILNSSKIRNGVRRKLLKSPLKNGSIGDGLRQRSIEEYFSGKAKVLNFAKGLDVSAVFQNHVGIVTHDGVNEMSRNSGVADVRSERRRRKDNESPRSVKPASRRSCDSPRGQSIKYSNSEAPRSPGARNESACSHSPRRNVESIQFSLPSKPKSTRTSIVTKPIPHYKIVAGTHFAVDAFSYGEIPNVKHYFLTHFHSDHYSGLKKGFNKLLFCSKITADLCVSRLGVSPKCIHIINADESLSIDGVEVTAVDANHCPGALMLLFTLPKGETLLHTGDFRATPDMESYPALWNKDIHTIYLDTTYCNPRYDFPTQDRSLEMAWHLLGQKKVALEKVGKEFSSVLIVCGTYTIGKEKFFLGIARRVGCSVWACPEKDRVLQVVEGRSFGSTSPQSCQLHVVPMRDLTHEKLRSYLDSLKGPFKEVVAFKPSGWENGKNSSVEKDLVTIHGIPYSEHSSFSEMIRFVKFLKPKRVVPTVDISGGVKAVQKFFPCPLVCKEDSQCQSKVTDFFSIHNRQQVTAVT